MSYYTQSQIINIKNYLIEYDTFVFLVDSKEEKEELLDKLNNTKIPSLHRRIIYKSPEVNEIENELFKLGFQKEPFLSFNNFISFYYSSENIDLNVLISEDGKNIKYHLQVDNDDLIQNDLLKKVKDIIERIK